MMTRKEAYATVSKHIFLASHAYSAEYDPVVVMADSCEDALQVAMEKFSTTNERAVCLEKLAPTDNEQIFEIVGV